MLSWPETPKEEFTLNTQSSELPSAQRAALILEQIVFGRRGDISGGFARHVSLLEQFCEVGSLKAEFFGCFRLIPSMFAQRLFKDLPAIGVHAIMVVMRGRSCLGIAWRVGNRIG